MHASLRGTGRRILALVVLWLFGLGSASAAYLGPYLVVDLGTGEVLAEHQSFDPWYPASITKLMTTYVTLKAIAAGEIRADSGVPMTADAARQPPSKMAFKPGTVVTVDTALKIIMVKSANDVAMALAQRVGGSLPAFVGRMNAAASALGMTGTHFANANGLPLPDQYTTARDYGLLARALLTEFPGYRGLYRITALSLGGKVINNHNNLLERFPGADGMKTGFICASGFNVVATAGRGDRRILVVVLGGVTAKARDELAAQLLEYGLQSPRPRAIASLDGLRPSGVVAAAPADIRDLACPKRRKGAPTPTLEDGDSDGGTVQPTSYLVPRFKVMDPLPITLGGASDMADAPQAQQALTDGPAALAIAADLPPLPVANPLRAKR